MAKMNIGRNDPCPCGIGKKYKKCCLDMDKTVATAEPIDAVFSELRQALGQKEFDSQEEVQAFADSFMQRANQAPSDDFHGLSPEQMESLLSFPYDSPPLVLLPEKLDSLPEAPILTLFNLLVEAIGEKGLKSTAKGNLPRQFCRDAALAFMGDEEFADFMSYRSINKEDDFSDLHITRLVAAMAGLIRKYKGRFILSRDCRRLLSKTGLFEIYPCLFRTYAEKFNWGYRDGYQEIPFVQHSFLFTLYLLNRYGDDWQSSVYYEDCFLRAFPMVLNEVEGSPYSTPEQEVSRCYRLRCLVNFAGFLGLAKVEKVATDITYIYDYRVQKLPLLDKVVLFR